MDFEMVMCAVNYVENDDVDSQEIWMDLEEKKYYKLLITPVIDHPHSDKENGQREVHYHVDNRYQGVQPYLKPHESLLFFDLRPIKGRYEFKKFPLVKHKQEYSNITPTSLIKNSKLKHKCIHKGKCPHRGYDLSNESPDNDGIITCPLHGLRFDQNKKLITEFQ